MRVVELLAEGSMPVVVQGPVPGFLALGFLAMGFRMLRPKAIGAPVAQASLEMAKSTSWEQPDLVVGSASLTVLLVV